MEIKNFKDECIDLINQVRALQRYDYPGIKSLVSKFESLGKKTKNYAATEEQGKIEVYIENSQKAKNLNKQAENWDDAKHLLIENIEIWIPI